MSEYQRHTSRTPLEWIKVFSLALVLFLLVGGCQQNNSSSLIPPSLSPPKTLVSSTRLKEVAPPASIQELDRAFDQLQPQVSIISPAQDQLLSDTTVAIQLQVKDLSLFQNAELEMGPHLHLILDNEPYQAVYSVEQPIILENLSPGTHSLRVFAGRPWHESFKNEGAFAQTTFHILTKTAENTIDPTLPLLTYSRPKGTYGAEPILLDFYLTNAPLHTIAQANDDDGIADWRIRVTINDESFLLDQWQPLYLKGFNPGKNWVKLEFIDQEGNFVANSFNSTVRVIDYQPNGQDALSKLIRGELDPEMMQAIVNPNTQSVKLSPVVEGASPITVLPSPPSVITETEPTNDQSIETIMSTPDFVSPSEEAAPLLQSPKSSPPEENTVNNSLREEDSQKIKTASPDNQDFDA